jgi:hypothetical protein
MRPVYAVQFEVDVPSGLSPASVRERVRSLAAGWVTDWYTRNRMPVPDVPLTGGDVQPAVGHAVKVQHVTAGGHAELWSLTWSHPADHDVTLLWTSECLVASVGADSGRLQDGGGPDRAPPTAAASVKVGLDEGWACDCERVRGLWTLIRWFQIGSNARQLRQCMSRCTSGRRLAILAKYIVTRVGAQFLVRTLKQQVSRSGRHELFFASPDGTRSRRPVERCPRES